MKKIWLTGFIIILPHIMTSSFADAQTAPPPDQETVVKNTGRMIGPGLPTDDSKQRRQARQATFKTGEAVPEIDTWRMWLVALILLLMVAGMIYILKRFGKNIIPGGGAQIITLKSRVQLDQKNSVALLRVYDQEFVVGSGPQGITLLAKLLPIDGVESELEEPPGNIDEDKVRKSFEEEFNLVASKVESEEIK